MMNIYKIIPNKDTYGSLQFDGGLLRQTLGRRDSRGLTATTVSIADKWVDCDGWFNSLYDESDIESYPDISVWRGSVLALSEKAREVLENTLKMAGEFLPFTSDKGKYFLFIPHIVIEVDLDNSEMLVVDGVEREPAKISFLSREVGTNVIFKTNYDQYTSVFCTEKLKSLIEKNRLTGVEFNKSLA